MIQNPTADELLEAVIGFIQERAAPRLEGRDAFLARVAVNALGVVRRELAQGPAAEAGAQERLRVLLSRDGDYDALNAELCEALRSGRLDAIGAVLDHLKASAVDQIGIDQPGYSGLRALNAEGRSDEPASGRH